MREVREETGLGPGEIEAFYDLDQVAPFYDEGSDAVVVSAIFAARVRRTPKRTSPGSTTGCAGFRPRTRRAWRSGRPTPSRSGACGSSSSIPTLEPWFRLDADGRRIARRPTA